MNIAGRPIGPGHPVFVVAEPSCNHAGSLERARLLVHAAARAGADAVKLQVYEPADLTCDSDHPAYRLAEGPWAGRRLWDLYEQAQTPLAWVPELAELAEGLGLVWFASVFSERTLALLEREGCPAYKIASTEACDAAFVRTVAATGKPLVLSDGMADAHRLSLALRAVAEAQGKPYGVAAEDVVVLRCVSVYPARAEDYRLGALRHRRYVGLSDHTMGHETAVAAVALGACMVEKHLMLERDAYLSYAGCGEWRGSLPLDAGHSVTPSVFAEYVQAIRRTEAALAGREMGAPEGAGSPWRRRLVFARDLPAGHIIGEGDVRTARCAEGLEPDALEPVLGVTSRAVQAGEPLTGDVVARTGFGVVEVGR